MYEFRFPFSKTLEYNGNIGRNIFQEMYEVFLLGSRNSQKKKGKN